MCPLCVASNERKIIITAATAPASMDIKQACAPPNSKAMHIIYKYEAS